MRLPVLAIALGAFAVGTTEFVVIGLLPTIAPDLGVDTSTAGLLVTGYAIGIAVGGPILTFATRRMAKAMAQPDRTREDGGRIARSVSVTTET
jgi:DHA1 family inner membrane transport protein